MQWVDLPEILARLIAAAATGAILGIDRDLHHKPAGLRVLSLVSLGSAVITILSVHATATEDRAVSDGVLRTVQGILSGIGFLGAGVILRADRTNEVHGITTAASVWVSAILGIVVGMGEWVLGTAAIVLTLLILTLGRYVERTIKRLRFRDESTEGNATDESNPPPVK